MKTGSGLADRVADGFLRKAARSRKAGGTLFHVKKSPLSGYRAYVEKMMPQFFRQSGEYSGTYVPGSLEWDRPANEPAMLATSHYFTFKQEVGGVEQQEEGKITARNDGNSFYIAVMLYS